MTVQIIDTGGHHACTQTLASPLSFASPSCCRCSCFRWSVLSTLGIFHDSRIARAWDAEDTGRARRRSGGRHPPHSVKSWQTTQEQAICDRVIIDGGRRCIGTARESASGRAECRGLRGQWLEKVLAVNSKEMDMTERRIDALCTQQLVALFITSINCAELASWVWIAKYLMSA